MRVFLIYVPLIAAAIAWNVAVGLGPAAGAAAFGSGLLLWTLLEYLIHRYAFHRLAPHYQHHEFPTDRRYILAPLWLSLLSAVALLVVLRPVAGSWSGAALVEAGSVTGYLAYELLHIRIHSEKAGGAVLRVLRRHHYYHHFADETKCFGVMTSFWDRVFGSLPQVPGSVFTAETWRTLRKRGKNI